ncbi:MAG TPA: GntR family transcriptional regulator [Longimicrobiaceae bacterium]|nr:GntR family transcriptional regulator [Longimicrobiaceae bacterium]
MPRTKEGAAPIPRTTVAMRTVEAIRERILQGEYAEGEPLRQDALASELGVSRIPVREALRQLQAEGLVTFSPHVGAVVSTLSLSEIREVFELRALIESDLLRRAIPAVGPMDVERAGEILDQYQAALKQGKVADWGSLNWHFHSTLYAPAAQPLTLGVVQGLHHQCDRYLRLQLSLTHGQARADEEHRAILHAVRDRSAQVAVSLLNLHILGAGHALVDFLREHRAR